MYIKSPRTSNKRCSKYYLLKCFEETREYSQNLEHDKEIFGTFLDKYKKMEVVMIFPLLANYVEVECLIEYMKSFCVIIVPGGL